MEKGKFVISLDFELLWGVFDKVDYRERMVYFENTTKVIPEILELFTEFEISGTWATVGMLFNHNWEEWEMNIPVDVPNYNNRNLCPYRFGQAIKSNKTRKLCFAPQLIQQIAKTPNQELATHTYSHYYCSEKGQRVETFRTDLEKAVAMAKTMGVALQTLVFPRNQLNPEYLRVCADLGIKTVRSNPDNWYWKETEESSIFKKIFRTGDAYLGFNDKSYPFSELKNVPGKTLEQKASRLLRPYTKNIFLNRLKLNRIRTEMKAAASKEEIYHLWWHPHNFGYHPQENLEDLRKILIFYRELNQQYGFESVCMKDIFEIKANGLTENV